MSGNFMNPSFDFGQNDFVLKWFIENMYDLSNQVKQKTFFK